ncbi:baseplate J/gp47 family protein [Paenibacillus pinisoli]|uniref:Baseplate J/gp47 family protein n=1 Tax=Paenibacillus pinisoli TaxID=1276110 RepID=A0A3A6PEF8_9BACL|nr:baseplate J/gp47 family protein [Paenibacillus pinisoli]RJX40052.1 baseplate J/gp47 family protein [Paenibacillus pinisoli]
MYEHMTFDFILQRMLARVSDDIDKRQGSVIYDACAPAAAELAQMYIDLDINYNLSFADSTSGEYLSRKAAEFGVNRNPATTAVRQGLFYNEANNIMDIAIGTRFSIGGLTYVVSHRSDRPTSTIHLTCETTGTVGNEQFGALLPIDYVPGLARAVLSDVIVPGEDEESDEALRQRMYAAVNEPPFGGNAADYKQKINGISGIGDSKIYPAWQGGGTVKCTVINSAWQVPSAALVDEVQTYMDPTVNRGQGLGQAPIGHVVTIAGVIGKTINIKTSLTLASGVSPGQVQQEIEAVVSGYLQELRHDWANQQQLVVRTAQIDARLLTVSGVEDITDTLINGAAANLTLGSDEVPLMGTVVLNA